MRQGKTNKGYIGLLLLVHGLITFAASVVLILAPAAIPKMVDIYISPDPYLLCYFLGAAQMSIAFLSFFARNISDPYALRIVCSSFIVFHIATALLEIYAFIKGVDSAILFNTGF